MITWGKLIDFHAAVGEAMSRAKEGRCDFCGHAEGVFPILLECDDPDQPPDVHDAWFLSCQACEASFALEGIVVASRRT